MFTVIHDFKDLQDDNIYHVGDKYPREGYYPAEKRIAELLGKRNAIGESLIEEDKKPEKKVEKVEEVKKDEDKPASTPKKKADPKKTNK